jgi:muramoyltetrapeptide carboxypeptidase
VSLSLGGKMNNFKKSQEFRIFITMKRRKFIRNVAGLGLASAILPSFQSSEKSETGAMVAAPKVLPKGLMKGHVIGITGPAGAIYEEFTITRITDRLTELGFKFKLGKTLYERYGYLAGTDQMRADELMEFYKDPSIDAILTMRGGWGCARILDLLDYEVIKQHPKVLMGFSDITSLVNAVYLKTGIVTYHGPCGYSTWTDFSTTYVTKAVAAGTPFTMKNPDDYLTDLLTLSPGKAEGELIGGNITVLVSMIGTAYEPNWQDKILFLEETNEEPYRIDRMFWQMKQAGIFNKVKGIVFGSFNKCFAEEPEKSFTLHEVLEQHFKGLSIPVYMGATFGHMSPKFTLPIGVLAEIDADNFTIKTLERSVSV